MCLPIPSQGSWLRAVLLGYYRYFAVPRNSLLRVFREASSALGAVRCGGAANVIVSLGDGCTRLRSSGYRNPESCILTLHNACALLPEARARCGNSARRDLCGAVPGNRHSYRDQTRLA